MFTSILMKRFLASLLVLTTFGIAAQAQSSVWKVTGEESTLYLGGSIHLLRESDYPLPEEYDYAYSQSQTLVLETDIKKLEDPSSLKAMMTKAMYQDERTLQSVLSEKVYKKLSEEAAALELPIANMAKMKPSIVITTFTMMKMLKMGISADGVDKHYYNKAELDQKSLGFLESVETQLDAITSMGEGNEDEYVLYSIRDFKRIEKELTEMIAMWRSGNDKKSMEQLKEMKKDYDSMYDDLLTNRNNAWMPQLVEFLKNDEVEFVVVGLLHMYGEDGLLEQLRSKGYTVEQVKL